MDVEALSLRTLFLSFLIIANAGTIESIEPLSISLGLGSGIGLAGLYAGYDYFYSMFRETCDLRWISPNLTKLSSGLDDELHGQHVVQELVVKALRIHLKRLMVDKPLVMSFHGWTGGGKNFVSKIIVDSIFKEGVNSQFVHWFIATVHFPHESETKRYMDDLQRWIKGNVTKCQLSVFVFDEVDKMPPGVLDAVKPFVDYYDQIDGTDFRRSIFIFLSNTGGVEITETMLKLWNENRPREDIKYQDFQELIHKGAFNEEGGLFHNAMIEKNLIDYYVPFLPLERKHVKLCIRDELIKRGETPTNELLDEIADEMPYFPEDSKLYSKAGCKRVAQKVDYILLGRSEN